MLKEPLKATTHQPASAYRTPQGEANPPGVPDGSRRELVVNATKHAVKPVAAGQAMKMMQDGQLELAQRQAAPPPEPGSLSATLAPPGSKREAAKNAVKQVTGAEMKVAVAGKVLERTAGFNPNPGGATVSQVLAPPGSRRAALKSSVKDKVAGVAATVAGSPRSPGGTGGGTADDAATLPQ